MLLKLETNLSIIWKPRSFCKCQQIQLNRSVSNTFSIIFSSFACTYEGDDLEIEVPPALKEGEKIHHPIYQDEICCHSNDQACDVWQREDEHTIREKSRGPIVHVSDFIIQGCGRLTLTDEEIQVQMKLPIRPPLPPPPPSNENAVTHVNANSNGKGQLKGKTREPVATDHLYDQLDSESTLPAPPTPHKSYCLPSFEARKIIHPGAGKDPWWDMP
jgi:hypothetical protein